MMHKNSRTKYIKKTIETKELVHTVELTQDQLDIIVLLVGKVGGELTSSSYPELRQATSQVYNGLNKYLSRKFEPFHHRQIFNHNDLWIK